MAPRYRPLAALAAALVLLFAAAPTAAVRLPCPQDKPMDEQSTAQSVLQHAIQAKGGIDRLRAVKRWS